MDSRERGGREGLRLGSGEGWAWGLVWEGGGGGGRRG